MISVSEADRVLQSLLPSQRSESVSLREASGRVLMQDIVADRDGPPFDRVTMDGVALAFSDWAEGRRSFTVTGFQAAGHPPRAREGEGTAIEIATGAVLPLNCDTVVPYEQFCTPGSRFDASCGPLLLPETLKVVAGRNVHRRGEDYRRGEKLLSAGTLLRSSLIHIPASVGLDRVEVVRRARWALASTGDELVSVKSFPLDHQIRSSNLASIAAEAVAWGLNPEEGRVLPDEPQRLREGIEKLSEGQDVIVLSGGVSAGALDLVPAVMAELGATEVFHKVRQKPGKPLWCGVLPNGTVVFGLPGNPVSSLFSFRRYVVPFLLSWEGRFLSLNRVKVSGLSSHRELRPGQSDETVNTLFLPVGFAPTGSDSDLVVLDFLGSGNFHQLVPSVGFVQVDSFNPEIAPRFFPWGLPGGAL